MEQKMKFIAIGLGVFCLILIIFAFFSASNYGSLKREYNELQKVKDTIKEENAALGKKIASSQEELTRVKEREDNMKTALDKAVQERAELQGKVEALNREKEKLMASLKKALAGASARSEESQQLSSSVQSDEYWASILKDKTDLGLQLANLRDLLRSNQIKVDELAKEKSILDLDIQRITKEREDIQRRLEYNEKLANNLSIQLYQEKQDKRKVQDQLRLFKEENYILRSRLKEAMNSKVGLEKKLKDAEDKRSELYNQLNAVDQVLQDKVSSLLDAKQDLSNIRQGSTPMSGSTIELSPIVVRSKEKNQQQDAQVQATTQDAENLSAKIVNVNDDNNFVILDIGENQGVHKGMTFHVWRGLKQIGSIEVIQARANVSAADIKEKSIDIKVGDVAR